MPRIRTPNNLNGNSNFNVLWGQQNVRQIMSFTEFMEHDPCWFVSTEAGFRVENIADPFAMFNYVVRC